METQFEQQALFEDARLDVGMSDGAEVNRVEPAQFGDRAGGQRFARPQVPLAAPIEVRRLEAESFEPGNGAEHLQCLGRHFRTRAVAGNHRQLQRLLAVHASHLEWTRCQKKTTAGGSKRIGFAFKNREL